MIEIRLDPVPAAPATARHAVSAFVRALGLACVRETAELLVTEAVTNALLHGAPPIEVRATGDAEHVRVAVSDHSPNQPVPRDPAPDEIGGRGLLLIDVLSTTWGVEPLEDGKSLWFEVRTP